MPPQEKYLTYTHHKSLSTYLTHAFICIATLHKDTVGLFFSVPTLSTLSRLLHVICMHVTAQHLVETALHFLTHKPTAEWSRLQKIKFHPTSAEVRGRGASNGTVGFFLSCSRVKGQAVHVILRLCDSCCPPQGDCQSGVYRRIVPGWRTAPLHPTCY